MLSFYYKNFDLEQLLCVLILKHCRPQDVNLLWQSINGLTIASRIIAITTASILTGMMSYYYANIKCGRYHYEYC